VTRCAPFVARRSMSILVSAATAIVLADAGSTAATSVRVAHGSEAVRLWATGPQSSSNAMRLRFAMPRTGTAAVRVLDVAGREVARLFDGVVSPGEHEVTWDGRDLRGHSVASGVYLVKLVTPDGAATSRVVRAR
jgi:flagellar hook assembly protein FlgD